MKLEVKKLCGPICTTLKNGELLYMAIDKCLKANEQVELDFTCVKIVAAPFFNAAIGQLYNDFSQECLDKNLRICNLVETGQEIIERVKDNAALMKDNEARKAIDDALTSAY